MATTCTKCSVSYSNNNGTCSRCKGQTEKVPKCKICNEDIYPHNDKCYGCGANRKAALNQ